MSAEPDALLRINAGIPPHHGMLWAVSSVEIGRTLPSIPRLIIRFGGFIRCLGRFLFRLTCLRVQLLGGFRGGFAIAYFRLMRYNASVFQLY